jgi:hypothetical protein
LSRSERIKDAGRPGPVSVIVSQRLQNELAFDQGECMPDEAFNAGAIGGRELDRADRWTLGRPFD